MELKEKIIGYLSEQNKAVSVREIASAISEEDRNVLGEMNKLAKSDVELVITSDENIDFAPKYKLKRY